MTTHALFSLLLAPSGQQGPGMGVFILQIGLFVAIFYFLLIRPQRQQQAKHRQLMASLQRGDQVVTSGGIIGEVVHLKDNEVTLRTGDTRVVVLRSSIANITNRGTTPELEAKK
jgi:preprotein translocase subunit YajC